MLNNYDMLILEFPKMVLKAPHRPLYETATSTRGWKLEMWHSGNGYIIQRHTKGDVINMSVIKFLPHARFHLVDVFERLSVVESVDVLNTFLKRVDEVAA